MKPLRFILLPMSVIYWIATYIRNFLFDKNIFKSTEFDVPVINVGNLSMGGAGKTPHCEYIIELLRKDYKIALLSRGYGRKTVSYKEVEPTHPFLSVGDEPLQVKTKFPEITVSVENNRVKGILNLLYDHPETEVVLLDDAFQHRSIRPGLNILLTKYHDPFFNDYIFPVGNLRESSRGSKRADLIIVTKCPEHITERQKKTVESTVKANTNAIIYFTKISYGKIEPIFNSPSISLNQSLNILLVTGIASTEHITGKLKDDKLNFKHLKYRDHYPFSEKDADKISEIFDNFASGNKKIILTTEKDAMRIKNVEKFSKLPFFYIPIIIEFISEKESFDQKLKKYVAND